MSTPLTLAQHIRSHAASRPEAIALAELDADGATQQSTWADYWRTVRALGKGLISVGLQPGDIVAQVGHNRRDWVFSQFGVMAAGGCIAPIYTTNTVEQTGYIVDHCGAKIGICDTSAQLDKLLAGQRQGLFALERIYTMDDVEVGERADGLEVQVAPLSQLIAAGEEGDDEALERRIDGAKPDDLALLIFTSGTTGLPKGAEFTHAGIAAVGQAMVESYSEAFANKHRYISYLPLCHAAEQAFTNFVGLISDSTVTFCSDLTRIKDYLVAVRPTLFFAVPRVWEKFEAALRGKLAEATGVKAKLARWAMKTELAAFERSVKTGREQSSLARTLANKLVLSKIRAALGLDALVGAGSGAAPISLSTLRFFASLGIVIHEGFGMTETTAFATVQPLRRPHFGTVGTPLPGVEVKISDDGEIMLRGANMIRGYLRLPDKTAELYTGGWMHTGDLGSIDDDGFLSITGRKKDLIITAGGKNVGPAEIEGLLQAIPGVGQGVVVGDRKPYLCALLVLDEDAIPELCAAVGIKPATMAELALDPRVIAFMQERIDQDCNPKLARYQTVKKFRVLPAAFSVDGGELTPTLKVKRNVVSDKYGDAIAAMYMD